MEPIEPPAVTGESVELFTLSLVGAMVIAVTLILRISRKRLRSRLVESADAPIVVE